MNYLQITPEHLCRLVEDRDVESLTQMLENTRVSERRVIAEGILQHCAYGHVLDIVHEFVESPSRFVRYTASLLVAELPVEWHVVSSVISRLADDEAWQVREGAAGALEVALASDFDTVWSTLVNWANSPNPNIRRAVILACMQKDVTESRLSMILDLLGGILPDKNTYVSKNLGPFVLGYLGRKYPNIVLRQIEQWAQSLDAQSRWNVAKAFSQSLGVRYPREALDILGDLATDKRTKVQRAVASSLLNIAKEEFALVQMALQKWHQDELRANTAIYCRKHLDKHLHTE